MNKKNNKFPKIKKTLKNFLTDESGKITKHNALGLGAVGALVGGASDAHSNWTHNFSPVSPSPGANSTFYTSPGCTHSSGIMNGTYSDVIEATTGGYYATHNSGGHSWSTNAPAGTQTFYLDCGSVNQSINGHYSSTGSLGASRETVTHSSSHSNY